jgi:signal transduction histidine kinase
VALRRRAHRRRAVSTRTTVKYEEVLAVDGGERHVLRMYHPVFEEADGEVAAIASYGVDISELKRSLRELDEARSEVDKVGRLKESFLENINEEFRAPISGIIGFAEILESEVPENQREFVNLIERNGRRLMNTLNAVLDLAGLNNNEFSLSPQVVNVVDEVKAVAEGCKDMVEEKGLFLRVEVSRPEILCRADQVCLARVVQNLIDNAVKCTDAGGVVVEIETDEVWVNIRVLDSGVGFDASRRSDVFDDFSGAKVDTTPFLEAGGIGLGITRRLVELMRGRIEVESELDEGSVFSVSLPRAFPRRGRYGIGLPRILVAETSSDSRTMIEYVFDSRLETRAVADVESFDLELRRMFYDVILIDTSIAPMSSLVEYIEQIRTRYKEHHVPVVAVDSKNVAQREEEFRSVGFDAYLAKPFKKQYLVSELSQILFDASFANSNAGESTSSGHPQVRKSA